MPSLLIKDLPPELHRKLKEEAARHHRSMTRQALALLEEALSGPARNAADLLPKPLKPAKHGCINDRHRCQHPDLLPDRMRILAACS